MNARIMLATRTHVILPDDLLAELDQFVGPRRRSEFISDVVREKLMHLRQVRAFRETAGVLRDDHIPEWDTPEATSEWVRKSREQDNERLDQILARWSEA